jgi:prepilin-type N-terminal cleavage/methylation domain-containing protein
MIMKRDGFTLIELLIVIVIIGILAAIALPKLSKVRERGYFKAVMSDLRNLQTQQEIYYGVPTYQIYATDVAGLVNFKNSPGVTTLITTAGYQGWAATGIHSGLNPATQMCAVFFGTVGTVPPPATTPGIVTCTGE